VEAEA